YLEPGDRGLVVTPAFGEYAPALVAAGAEAVPFPADPHDGLVPDPEGVAAAVRRQRPRLTYLCNPSNPGGRYWPREAMEGVLSAVETVGGLLALDEAYHGFVEQPWDATPLLPGGHVVLLRSMTKDLALAGLRLGYLVGHPAHVEALAKARPPWSVNALALAAGAAALADPDHAERSRRAALEARERLPSELAALGYRTLL